jgi:osmotically-inducible protein OsmY
MSPCFGRFSLHIPGKTYTSCGKFTGQGLTDVSLKFQQEAPMRAFKNISMFAAALTMASMVGCAAMDDDITVAEAVDDAVITTRIKAALAADDQLKAREIQVETREGVVQLSGFVDQRDHIAKATDLADGIEGVRSVQNDIILR